MSTVRTLIVAGLMLTPATASAEQKVWTRSFSVTGQAQVRVISHDARVNVHAHPGSTVDVRVELLGSVSGLSIGKITPHVRIEQNGGVIEVEVDTKGVTMGITFSDLRFEVEVSAPAGTDVEAHCADGSLMITGLRGHVTVNSADASVALNDLKGQVSLRSSDGSVTAKGLDGRLDASTKDGGLRVSGRFDDLDLESHDGQMDVEVASGSTMGDGWDLATMDGGIRLQLPEGLKLTLDASVRDGNLDVEVDEDAAIDADDLRAVRLDLNGGGPLLRIRTHDGSVKIRGVS